MRPALEMERPYDDDEPSPDFDITRIVRNTSITHMKDLPEPEEGVLYVVGTSAAMAAYFVFERDDIITPDLGNSAIRDRKGNVVAVTRFIHYVDGVERPAGGLGTSVGVDSE